MQEGTVAFLQMVKIAAAVAEHRAVGLPYLVYLRNPTTGGVFASWGSLGHVTLAEPGALIGFLGPRVYEALYGRPFPEGVQRAENLYEHGLVDAVLPAESLAQIADRTLTVLLAERDGLPPVPELPKEPLDDIPAWESICISRRPERPGVRQLLRTAATDVVPLNGTGQGEQDPGLLIALARFGGAPCVLLGQDRRGQTPEQPLGPAAMREARRGMGLAAELRLPLVTVIDTAGVALTREAEEGGLSGEIARCIAELVTLEAPTLCLLLGQGRRRRCARPRPRRSSDCGAARLAVAAPTRGRQRHRASQHGVRGPDGGRSGCPFARPVALGHRRPHRRRAPRCCKRTGRLLRARWPGAGVRADHPARPRFGRPARAAATALSTSRPASLSSTCHLAIQRYYVPVVSITE